MCGNSGQDLDWQRDSGSQSILQNVSRVHHILEPIYSHVQVRHPRHIQTSHPARIESYVRKGTPNANVA